MKNDELHRNYHGYVFEQVTPGFDYSLVQFVRTELPPNPDEDPYFKEYDIIEYIEQNGTSYVLLSIRPDQNHETLFTHLKTIAMTLPDTPERNSTPIRHYSITVLLPGDGGEHMSKVLNVATGKTFEIQGTKKRETISLFLPVPN